MDDSFSSQTERYERRSNLIYSICFFLGIGTLLPYNFFINANEYFKYKLRDVTLNSSDNSNQTTHLQHIFVNTVNVSANISTTLCILWITLYGTKISINLRIKASLILILTIFILTSILTQVNTDSWQNAFFILTIGSVVFINAGAAIYGTSLFGFISSFPSIYIQAICMGQVAGGLFAASTEMLSISFLPDPVESGLIFFIIACVFIFLNLMCYHYMQKMDYVRYYRNPNKAHQAQINDNEFDSDDGEVNMPLLEKSSADEKRSGLKAVGAAFRQSKFFLLTTFFIFATTYAVYPGILSSVKSMSKTETNFTNKYFIPLMFLLQSLGDFLSRFIGGIYPLSVDKRKAIGFLAYSRIILIPLAIFCNIQPRSSNNLVFFGDVTFYVLSFMVGLSNGYVCTICLMYIPKVVESSLCEVVSAMGQFFLMFGIVTGSVVSFLLTSIV